MNTLPTPSNQAHRPQHHPNLRCLNVFAGIVTTVLFLMLAIGAKQAVAADDWNTNSSGNWSDTTKWLNGTVPNGVGDTADIIHGISTTRTITLDIPVTLGTLRLGDDNNSAAFILNGSNALTFDNGGLGAVLDHSVGSGNTGGPNKSPSSSDRLEMDVILNDSMTIYAGRNIEFRGVWDAQGNDIVINDIGRTLFQGNNGSSNNGRIINAGKITVNEGELRFDGQAGGTVNYIDTPLVELSNGVIGTGTRVFARLYLVNTEATQDFDLNMNGGAWFVNDLGNNNQTFTGNIVLTNSATTNIIDVNDAGTPEVHTFTGVISGTGGFSKINSGAMVLTNNNTFEGDLYVQRGRSSNLGSVHLQDADGALSGTSGLIISRDGSFYLDNSSVVNNDRINDTADMTLRGSGRIRLIGNSASAVSETVGDLLIDTGAGRINMDLDDSTPNDLTWNFASLSRSQGAVAQFQVLDNTPGAFGTTAKVYITDSGATLTQYGSGGANGTSTQDIVVGVFGGVNDISNHFMTFDKNNPTLLRPLDFTTEYLLPRDFGVNGTTPFTFDEAYNATYGLNQNLNINYNTAIEGEVDNYANNPIRITTDTAFNSLRFGTETPTNGANTNELGSTLSLDAGMRLYLGDSLAVNTGLASDTNGSGMILFGRAVNGTSPGSNQYITGGIIDFGSREAIIVNESGNSALIRSEITGTGGLTKAGAQAVYLDNTNSYSGTTNIAEGVLDVRDSGGLGNSTLVQTQGSGSLYLELGTVLPETIDLRIGVLDTSRTVLKSNAGNNTFKGNIIVDNVDDLGNLVYTPYINVSTGDTLNLDGLIYGALASNPLSSDTALNDARIVSTNGSGAGIININGTFQDNINGAGTAVSGATENELLRFQVTGNNQVVVNVRNQWNAAGNILLERGYLRYEGDGNFWTDDAASAITPSNSQSGMRISGSSSTNTGNVSFVLTKDGQKLNIDRIDIGANGSSDNYNDLGNVMLAGTNTSGTVTFGNGTERIVYQSSDSARSHTRDLSLYAAGGGTVNLDFRLDDTDSDVHTSFTKIGRGVVNYNGQNGSNAGDVEQVNLSGGLLRLTNYGSATNTRFDNGAMVIFAGGGLELDGIGSVGNETENLTGTAVGGSITVPTGTIEVRPGATDVIVTSDAGRTTTLNIGDSTIDLLRSSGGTLHFVENSNGGTSAITLEGKAGSSLPTTGSAIAWATYGDSYTYDAASASYTINALDFATITGTEDVSSLAGSLTRENTDDVSTWTNGNDVSENATGFTGTTGAGVAVNTLHFDFDGASTLTVDAGGLEVTSGGIMVSSAVATLGSTKLITGGDLTTSAGTDLIVHQFGRDALTIDSNIVDNGGTALVKAGSGDLILTGSANTYAGGTFLNGGTLIVDDIAKLGATPASTDASNLYFNGGALRFTANTTIDSTRGIMLGGNGGEINVDDTVTVTYDGFIDAEPNVIANYAANPAVGRLDKTGAGTLLLTQVANQNFAGLLDIKEGTLSWAPTTAVANNSVINAFGTNDAFLDGTIVRNGATLDISPASASGITSNVFLNEWVTFEAGSTFNVAENSDDNRSILMRGVLKFESNGKTGFEAATIIDVNRNTLQFNDDGGYMTGDGNIFKTGAGNIYLRENSPEFTGQWIIAEGLVSAFSAGTPLGVSTAPILLGHNLDAENAGELVSGNTVAALLFRDEGGYRDVSTITQDIIVRDDTGAGSQTKRIGAWLLAHADVVNYEGNITLNDDLELYYRDDTRNSAGTSNADVRNDNRSNGAPTNSETVFINFNGNFIGDKTISTNMDQFGNANTINGSITGAMDDFVNIAIFGFNGDNSNWTGALTIRNDDTATTDDVDRIAIIRLGNEKALGDNLLRFGARGYLQMAGLSKTFTQNALFIGGSGLGTTAKIQNASETDITLTFFADATKIDSSFQDIGVGMEDGLVFGGKLKDQGLLNVVKSGPGHTVFGASTGGGDIFDSFSSYKGSTTIEEGILYAGSNNSLSPYSRFIVNDGATLSLYFDEASTGFENTIGSLSGDSGALVNIDSSILSLGGDNTSDADFSGLISGIGNLYKVGTGSQRLSGDNTFEASEVAIVEGALIGGSNTAFGNSLNIIQLGGVPLVSINPADARVELLLDGSANAMDYYIQMNAFDGNYEGVTIIGTRASSGTYGFSSLSYLEATSNYFARADGNATFQFGGEINDQGYETTFTKIGAGTVEFHQANLYGSFGSAGQAIDGGTFIREGFLSLLNEGALASTVVELGDIRHTLSENVYLATSSPLVTPVLGSFDPDSDGITGSGNGAFLFVSAEIDGVLLTSSDIGKRILVKDEHDHPERNGVYEVVSVDTVRNLVNLVRASDFDEDTEMLYGTSVLVDNGNQSGNSYFMISPDVTSVNAEETDPVHWEQESTNANLGLYAGLADLTITNDIDLNDTHGTGSASIGGLFTSGNSTFTGNITLQHQDGMDNIREVTLASASNDDSGTGEAGTIFTGILSEAELGDTLHVRIDGGGTVTLTSDALSYTGKTTVGADSTLRLYGDASIVSSQWLEVESGGIFNTTQLNSSSTYTAEVPISGNGTLQPGVGNTLVISGDGVIRPGLSSSPYIVATAGDQIGSIAVNGDLDLTAGGSVDRVFLQMGSSNGADYNDAVNIAANSGAGLNAWLATQADTYDSYTSGNHDRLTITGDLALDSDGYIRFDNDGGNDYTPQYGDIFNLLDWGTLTQNGFDEGSTTRTGGLIGDLYLPNLPANWFYNTSLFSSHGLIVVVPEPSRTGLLLGALLLLTLRRRRSPSLSL